MSNIRSFCKTCVDTKDVTDMTFGIDGVVVYTLECGHSRFIQYNLSRDEM